MMRVFAAALFLSAAAPALAQQPYAGPIFDAHVHYSQPAWTQYPPEAVIKLFDGAGVSGALVSSTPDDGTLALKKIAPGRIVAELRPYKDGIGSGNWAETEAVIPYLEERLKKGGYAGIGEFHLHGESQAAGPVVKKTVALARGGDLYIHVHSGAAPVHALFALDPKLKILWAHAGMSEPAQVVADLLGRYPNLIAEVSFRAGDILAQSPIDPQWKDLMIRFQDRILVGTDTYVTGRWDQYKSLIDDHRRWLGALPPDVAAKIAEGNAKRLFK